MHTVSAFVLLLSLIKTSLADASEDSHCSVSKLADVSQIPWKFYFNRNGLITLCVQVINKSPSVIVNNLIVKTDGNISGETLTGESLKNKWLYYFFSSHKSVEIFLEYNTSISSPPHSLFVALGRDVSLLHQEEIEKEFGLLNCLESSKFYTLTVDLKNFNGAKQESSQGSVLIYVLPPIVASCLILVIYLGVKKYRRRKSRPIESIELDTYASTNHVVYAELSLAHGDGQTLEFNENTPYAKIIGVMKPANTNSKK